jgi:hypothetical protein
MIMQNEVIPQIETLVKKGLEVVDVNGRDYCAVELVQITEPIQPSLTVSTLDGLVDFIKSGVDRDKSMALVVHVEGPRNVKVYLPVLDDSKKRPCLVAAEFGGPEFSFDRFIDQENFVIGMQALFVDGGQKEDVLKVVGNLTSQSEIGQIDDGVSQTVTAKTGIASVSAVELPNPVSLIPRRTFTEVDQVQLNFILRMRDGGAIGLFEADGGAWKATAIDRVAEYLKAALDGADDIFIIS